MIICSFTTAIDDRPHKANCERFAGRLVRFGTDFAGWPEVLDLLRALPPAGIKDATAEADEARDAARFRWLCNHPNKSLNWVADLYRTAGTVPMLCRAIDAEIAADAAIAKGAK